MALIKAENAAPYPFERKPKMSKEFVKPRFPAYLFHRLRHYPRKLCETCGKSLVPKTWMRNGKMQLESPHKFSQVRFCSVACRRGSAKKSAAKVAYSDESKVCAFEGCRKVFHRRIVNGVLEPKSVWEKKRYCFAACGSRAYAAGLKQEKEQPELTKQATVIDQLRTQLPPKQKSSPVAKPVQHSEKEASGPKPKPAPKVAQPEPPVQTPTAEQLKAQQNALKPYEPSVKSRPQGEPKDLPQSFYNDSPREHSESEIERERRKRVKAGTWDPTPEGQKIDIDPELKLALFQAFGRHEEAAFLEFFGDAHPGLVKDYRRWQKLDPVLRERRVVA